MRKSLKRRRGSATAKSAKKPSKARSCSVLPSIEDVIKAVSTFYKVEPAMILGDNNVNRYKNNPRKIAIYLACRLAGQNQKFIGQQFNRISFSAVSHLCRRLEDEFESDENLLEAMNEIKKKLIFRKLTG